MITTLVECLTTDVVGVIAETPNAVITVGRMGQVDIPVISAIRLAMDINGMPLSETDWVETMTNAGTDGVGQQ